MSQEQDSERLLYAAGQTLQTAITTGVATWMMDHPKQAKVEIRTAAQDLQDASQALEQGASTAEVKNSLKQGEVYQRIQKQGGDAEKYLRLINQKAEIEKAVSQQAEKKLNLEKTIKQSKKR